MAFFSEGHTLKQEEKKGVGYHSAWKISVGAAPIISDGQALRFLVVKAFCVTIEADFGAVSLFS